MFEGNKMNFVPIDQWVPTEEDKVFKSVKGSVYLNVSKFYGIETSTQLDYFSVAEKRGYNSDAMRDHLCHYLNYFIKFYDQDRELESIYFRLKYLMDCMSDEYTQSTFLYDIKRYILSPSILNKIDMMNNDNYQLSLNYSNDRNPSLQYNDTHGLLMMKISILMNMVIPLAVHFIHVKKIYNVNEFLLEVYDILIHTFGVDIYSKLYETATTNITKNKNNNKPLWEMQDIRGKNVTTHSLYSVDNIILNIMPKYTYNENMVFFNYRSIIKSTKYQITDIGWFSPLNMVTY